MASLVPSACRGRAIVAGRQPATAKIYHCGWPSQFSSHTMGGPRQWGRHWGTLHLAVLPQLWFGLLACRPPSHLMAGCGCGESPALSENPARLQDSPERVRLCNAFCGGRTVEPAPCLLPQQLPCLKFRTVVEARAVHPGLPLLRTRLHRQDGCAELGSQDDLPAAHFADHEADSVILPHVLQMRQWAQMHGNAAGSPIVAAALSALGAVDGRFSCSGLPGCRTGWLAAQSELTAVPLLLIVCGLPRAAPV